MKNYSYIKCVLAFSSLVLALGSCGISKEFKGSYGIHQKIKQAKPFKESLSGFAIYNPRKKQWLYRFREKKRFVPASNMKIITLYTSLETLGDSIAAFRYVERGDSLIFWGTGDPSFLNPRFYAGTRVFDFFRKNQKQLYFSSSNYKDQKYNAGWAWDDASYSYQTEKSPFPIHRNIVRFYRDTFSNQWSIRPHFFIKNTKINPRHQRWVSRETGRNQYYVKSLTDTLIQYKRDYPFIYSERLFLDLIQDLTRKKMRSARMALPQNASTFYSIPSDTLYKEMMHPSDNFLAEQQLLLVSNELFDELNTKKTIQFVRDSLLAGIPDNPRWVDGSGLSRYNLISPRAQVWVLEKILAKHGLERLKNIFPEGGKSGTIRKWYSAKQSYVFAKTGTMSGVHCLSGYLITRKGEVLVFSFMHNNYRSGSKPYKVAMQQLLEYVRDKY